MSERAQVELRYRGVHCQPRVVGEYWLTFMCRGLMGREPPTRFLNHCTGRLSGEYDPILSGIDLDSPEPRGPVCAPLRGATLAFL